MKQILITGAGSYVGTQVEQYLLSRPEGYQVTTLDVQQEGWENVDFSGYDSIFHVAGIVHLKGAEAAAARTLYYQVNRDLTLSLARKAKAQGVGQFLFMSTASVYGENDPVGKEKVITRTTPVCPVNDYGKSKLEAEEGLLALNDSAFHVAILRPPMIYGKGCRGNYQTLAMLARKLPVFPKVNNRRSMLYIRNLAEFVRLMVENNEQGLFWPQDEQLINTSVMAREIARANGRNILLIPGVTWALKVMGHVTGMVNKAFGSLYYDPSLSQYRENYCICSVEQAIAETEA